MLETGFFKNTSKGDVMEQRGMVSSKVLCCVLLSSKEDFGVCCSDSSMSYVCWKDVLTKVSIISCRCEGI